MRSLRTPVVVPRWVLLVFLLTIFLFFVDAAFNGHWLIVGLMPVAALVGFVTARRGIGGPR